MKKIIMMILVLAVGGAVACQSKPGTPSQQTKEIAVTQQTVTEPNTSTVDASKKYTAVIKTSKGDIVVELYPKEAPLSVSNFKQLADAGFYNGLMFHRVVPGFVIQGGDPQGTGSGGPGYTVAAEIGLPHKKGALAWARLGDEVNPDQRSSGSQFYITLEPTPMLDGKYTVFGQTLSGMDIVEKIAKGDKIESVTVKLESNI